eukprot:CAMPEP_0202690680 /NCGR_PEP_ID=MMETSP1385-20130828/5597_1 /ASSEMBLY_ACC=CAM_ASM_000861 /TAXON_ID=933848 /ORGANISM="Elphidium margaritaceum" /LENGTH=297 /DNA_ID=CAMNT_0049345963 /DNA_START=46 /DNA_END=939 /DNA_ORIENTATION=+
MCLTCCCDVLYKARCFCWKILLPILWVIDLILTGYLIYALWRSNIFACCTTNNGAVGDWCGQDDLGGASNVFVNEYGYCGRKDTGYVCHEIGECAEAVEAVAFNVTSLDPDASTFGDMMCNADVLDQVATYNYMWLNIVLIVKVIGLIFLLLLDVASCIKKIDADEEEAKQSQTCGRKCKEWGCECCQQSLVFILKVFFIVFGTLATFAAIYYMQLTGHVWISRCAALEDDSLQELCELTEESCNNDENYYAVVFDSLDLKGPFWFDFVSNILHSVLWVVRVAVMRYALKTMHLTDV